MNLYLEVIAHLSHDFFQFEGPFSDANCHSIKLLSEQSKNQILMQLFPLRLRIYLVPLLNVMTIEADSKMFDTDSLLQGLLTDHRGE